MFCTKNSQDNFHTSYKIWMTVGRSLILNHAQDKICFIERISVKYINSKKNTYIF